MDGGLPSDDPVGAGPSSALDDGDAAAAQYWRAACCCIVLIGSTLYLARNMLRSQNSRQDVAGEVDEIFQPKMSKEEMQALIASKHAECTRQADEGTLDLDALGDSAFPDMPMVVLVQVLEVLLLAGTEAVKEDDHQSAVHAFSEALALENCARPEGSTMADLPKPLLSVTFRLLLARMDSYKVIGKEALVAEQYFDAGVR